MATNERIFHGARADLYVDDVRVGWMTDISGSVTYNNVVFEECGTPIPTAIEIVGVMTEFTAGTVRILSKDPVAAALLPAMEKDTLIDWPYMTAKVKDSKEKTKVIFKIIGCKPASYSFQVTARGLAAQNQRWTALEFHHESEG